MELFRKLKALLSGADGADQAMPESAPPAASPVSPVGEVPLAPPALDVAPDAPQSFGYTVNWFAVRASDPRAVLDAAGLQTAWPANWASGLGLAYQGSPGGEGAWVFASPVVDGWVLLVGRHLPYPVSAWEGSNQPRGIGLAFEQLLDKLAARFDEVQFFGSYRVVDFSAWTLTRQGRHERQFSYADGTVLAHRGPQTRAEAELGFVNLDQLTDAQATERLSEVLEENQEHQDSLVKDGMTHRDAWSQSHAEPGRRLPDEDAVMALARRWSIDPSQLEARSVAPGTGLVAPFPRSLQIRQ